MVTEVDIDGRHEDLPQLRNELEIEKNARDQRNVEINTRARSYEKDLAALEAEGAKATSSARPRRRGARDGEHPKRANGEIERLDQASTAS